MSAALSAELVLRRERAWSIDAGDSAELLKRLPDHCADALVTDPPAGIALAGKEWDRDRGGRDKWVKWLAGILSEARRILKPGAHALVWGLPRTSHWTASAVEDAGFELRDRIAHVFGQGFPKGLDVAKAIDKRAGHHRGKAGKLVGAGPSGLIPSYAVTPKGSPITPAARAWDGWNTTLKPAVEDWWLARTPISGPLVDCVLEHGTGALNIGATRVGDCGGTTAITDPRALKSGGPLKFGMRRALSIPSGDGRWPPNLALTHDHSDGEECGDACPVAVFARTSGGADKVFPVFYSPKISVAERSRGQRARTNSHPTVKPLRLMEWLCCLVTPPGGVIIDPFAGSGSTGIAALRMGFRFVGIEKDPETVAAARERIVGEFAHARGAKRTAPAPRATARVAMHLLQGWRGK